MKVNLDHYLPFCFCFILLSCGSNNKGPIVASSTYIAIEPAYEKIRLLPTTDTIRFQLDENSYSSLKSFNTFQENGIQYISFFERRSGDINIYNVSTFKHVKKIHIDEKKGGKDLINSTVYCKNFDTILVNNVNSLLLIDSSGHILKAVRWMKDKFHSEVVMENTRPPVVQNGKLFIGIRPSSQHRDKGFLKKWKILFRLNILEDEAEAIYQLPAVYRDAIYGYFYQDYNYCLNDKGKFVISFPLDTNIYETDMDKYHLSYFGKSKFHIDKIQPMVREGMRLRDDHQHYSRNFAYGAIHFDPHCKRYIRIAREAIPAAEFSKGVKKRKSHMLIFDEKFQIIGESDLPADVSSSSLFFTQDGKVYARTKTRDEYAINFVRLQYEDAHLKNRVITKK